MGAVLTRMICRGGLVLLLSLCLAACDTPATPVAAVTQPGESAESPAVPAEATAPPLRYGITETTRPYLSETTLSELRQFAQVDTWSADTDPATFDIVTGYGTFSDWQQSPVSHQMLLLINGNLPPLDNPRLREIVQEALDPAALADTLSVPGLQVSPSEPVNPALLRTELANLGYPDGFRLTLAYPDSSPAADHLTTLRQQLINSNIETVPLLITPADIPDVLQANRTHLVLVMSTQPEQVAQWEAASQNVTVVSLYTLPIRYAVRDDLAVDFTSEGWPLPNPGE